MSELSSKMINWRVVLFEYTSFSQKYYFRMITTLTAAFEREICCGDSYQYFYIVESKTNL